MPNTGPRSPSIIATTFRLPYACVSFISAHAHGALGVLWVSFVFVVVKSAALGPH
jgi:hypothetical protein